MKHIASGLCQSQEACAILLLGILLARVRIEGRVENMGPHETEKKRLRPSEGVSLPFREGTVQTGGSTGLGKSYLLPPWA